MHSFFVLEENGGSEIPGDKVLIDKLIILLNLFLRTKPGNFDKFPFDMMIFYNFHIFPLLVIAVISGRIAIKFKTDIKDEIDRIIGGPKRLTKTTWMSLFLRILDHPHFRVGKKWLTKKE